MNEKNLYRAIGELPDDLIMDAAVFLKKTKTPKLSRMIAIAAALVLLLSLTAWAATVLLGSRSGYSRNIPDYYNPPSPETLQQDIGIAPHIIDSFSNGYAFKSGHIVYNEDKDQNGNLFERYKGINCVYEKGSQQIFLDADASIAGNAMEDEKTAEKYKGSEIKYFSYTNKCVPGNYQLTEQDQKDQQSGKYVFSYGSDVIEVYEVQILGWEYNGLNYSICTIDNELAQEELVQMAKEMIDFQNGGTK